MQRVVGGIPPVLRTLTGAQRRVRMMLGLRRSRTERQKLAAFKKARVDRAGAPAASLSFDLFVMVAAYVLPA